MADFTGGKDLTGSRFEDVDLTGTTFRSVDLINARFRHVDLTGTTMRDVALLDVDITGEIQDLRINGVDVVPLVQAELDRRYPDRPKMRPADADGFREAWAILERLWQQTVGRAQGMAPELLHERVDGEWSFTETLRHLVFATDAWVRRAILGIRPRGTLWTCRSTRCRTSPVFRVTAPRGHPLIRFWRCAPTAWPPCARSSPISPTRSWPA